MKAVLYETFKELPKLVTVEDPTPDPDGVVIKVEATGLCRSDWHGWMGHDSDIVLPHVPGHEFAGVIVALGKNVRNWTVGDRVTVPFISGCGACSECHAGHQQVCHNQQQPGFTQLGVFCGICGGPSGRSEPRGAATGNGFCHRSKPWVPLCHLLSRSGRSGPNAGRTMGCGAWMRWRGIVCGDDCSGGWAANVIAIDIDDEKLNLAQELGAVATINGARVADVPEAVIDLSRGGAHVSLDALGHPLTCFNSIQNLRPRGKHVQVGLMLAEHSTPSVADGESHCKRVGDPRIPRHASASVRRHAGYDRIRKT